MFLNLEHDFDDFLKEHANGVLVATALVNLSDITIQGALNTVNSLRFMNKSLREKTLKLENTPPNSKQRRWGAVFLSSAHAKIKGGNSTS